MKTTKTAAQTERQHATHRDNGKYAATNPCQSCGKSAGASYFSDCRNDELETAALILCKRCATKGQNMDDEAEALAFYTSVKPAPKAKK